MSELIEAISHARTAAGLAMFAIYPQEPADHPNPVDWQPTYPVRPTLLQPPGRPFAGLWTYTYDLEYDAVPTDIEGIVRAWSAAAVTSDALVAWFDLGPWFSFDHVLTPDVADRTYAIAGVDGVELALADDYRHSSAWHGVVAAKRDFVFHL